MKGGKHTPGLFSFQINAEVNQKLQYLADRYFTSKVAIFLKCAYGPLEIWYTEEKRQEELEQLEIAKIKENAILKEKDKEKTNQGNIEA